MKSDADSSRDKLLEDQFKQRLLELGLLTTITPPQPLDAFPKTRQPIALEGRPASRILLDERR
jgi:hypothetical protein